MRLRRGPSLPNIRRTMLVRIGAALGLCAVALGAFGAHGLRTRVGAEGLEIWRTAALYHLVHAVALTAVALAADRVRAALAVCVLFAAGVLIFSGTLYVLVLTGERWLGMVTPVGGVAFIAGWATLLVAGLKR